METFVDNTPLWDLSHSSSFSRIDDDDFLALLQKQFPTVPHYPDAINPQSLSHYSDDSSPSPPEHPTNDDPALKRKASDDSLDEGPSQKTQHTGSSTTHLSLPCLYTSLF